MNERIIETPAGNILLYRDIDENGEQIVNLQSWYEPDDAIFVRTAHFESDQDARQYIFDYSLASAQLFLEDMVATNSPVGEQ